MGRRAAAISGEAAPSGVPRFRPRLDESAGHIATALCQGRTALRGRQGAMAAGELGQSPACPGKQGRRQGEQGGDHLSLFLLLHLALGSCCRETEKMQRNPHAPSPPPIIFLSGRKCPEILKHYNSAGLYSLWKKMIRRCLGENL